jgi:hypothetical protein
MMLGLGKKSTLELLNLSKIEMGCDILFVAKSFLSSLPIQLSSSCP